MLALGLALIALGVSCWVAVHNKRRADEWERRNFPKPEVIEGRVLPPRSMRDWLDVDENAVFIKGTDRVIQEADNEALVRSVEAEVEVEAEPKPKRQPPVMRDTLVWLNDNDRRDLLAFLTKPNGASRYFKTTRGSAEFHVEAVEGGGVLFRVKAARGWK